MLSRQTWIFASGSNVGYFDWTLQNGGQCQTGTQNLSAAFTKRTVDF
jgi:hypothetical protein